MRPLARPACKNVPSANPGQICIGATAMRQSLRISVPDEWSSCDHANTDEAHNRRLTRLQVNRTGFFMAVQGCYPGLPCKASVQVRSKGRDRTNQYVHTLAVESPPPAWIHHTDLHHSGRVSQADTFEAEGGVRRLRSFECHKIALKTRMTKYPVVQCTLVSTSTRKTLFRCRCKMVETALLIITSNEQAHRYLAGNNRDNLCGDPP